MQKIDRQHLDYISERESQVLELIAFELSTKEIAQELYICTSTVNSHRKNMMKKLEVKNTAGLVRRGFELGLLSTIGTQLHVVLSRNIQKVRC